jgi:hypothetical protein
MIEPTTGPAEIVSALVARGLMADVTGRLVLRELRAAEGTADWPVLLEVLTSLHERLLDEVSS